jgi:hypothetical protein
LRAEGLNGFGVADISSVSASMLNGYDVVILGEMPITAAQATMFTTWVNAGGNLIAMRPDATLAGLLGLAGKGPSTLANGYLLVELRVSAGTRPVPGADQYGLAGATMVATLKPIRSP